MRNTACLYFDYNATTPIRDEVKDVIVSLLNHHGNPSSTHAHGQFPKQVIETARAQVARSIGARGPKGVFFCSCGTEADQWALWTAVCEWKQVNGPDSVPHIVASAVEHPAVLVNLKFLAESLGWITYTLVGVDEDGVLDLAALDASITPNTCLVSIMHSNNETGAMQDFNAINSVLEPHREQRKGAQDRPLALHSDLAQSIGRSTIDVNDMKLDFATIVGHKIGAPKGIAALWVAEDRRESLVPLIHGGGQESGKRSGTENLLLCGALGAAIGIATFDLDEQIQSMREMRDRFRDVLLEAANLQADSPNVMINGPVDDAYRLPNTLSISFKGVDAATVIAKLGDRLAISSGSACHGGGGDGSVLGAMGRDESWRKGTFRISVGFGTTAAEVDEGAKILGEHLRIATSI